MVMILVNYLDIIITNIFQNFQTLVTNITANFLYVSGKKIFKVINEIDKWQIRDINVTTVLYMAIVVFRPNKELYLQYRGKK